MMQLLDQLEAEHPDEAALAPMVGERGVCRGVK
jgi:hypothetical protein